MRKLMTAALAGAGVAAGALAGSAAAQPFGYAHPPAYQPHHPDGHYRGPVYTAPAYRHEPSGAALAMSVLGSLPGTDPGHHARVPVDRYGPDPNGMIGPDGRRIKCKLRRGYDDFYDGYVTRRVCWSR